MVLGIVERLGGITLSVNAKRKADRRTRRGVSRGARTRFDQVPKVEIVADDPT